MTIISNLKDLQGSFLKHSGQLDEQWAKLKTQKELVLVLSSPSACALAFKVWPKIKENVQLIIYAGGTFEKGDATPFAENSIYQDPSGMESLLNSGVPIVFVTLEAAAKKGCSPYELAMAYEKQWTLDDLIYCGVHVEIQPAARCYGKLIADNNADKKFPIKNAYIFK